MIPCLQTIPGAKNIVNDTQIARNMARDLGDPSIQDTSKMFEQKNVRKIFEAYYKKCWLLGVTTKS